MRDERSRFWAYSAIVVALLAGCVGGDDTTPIAPAQKPEVSVPAPPPRENATQAPAPAPVAPTPTPPPIAPPAPVSELQAAPPPPPAPAEPECELDPFTVGGQPTCIEPPQDGPRDDMGLRPLPDVCETFVIGGSACWSPVMSEDWSAPVFGGWVRHAVLRCAGPADPDFPRGREFQPAGATWSHFGSSAGSAWPDAGKLRIKAYSAGAVLAWPTFDHTRPTRVSAAVDVAQADGAWVGLTLIQDESDYREIALEWHGDQLWVELYAPCYAKRLERVEPGPRVLTLEYVPDQGWWYVVDGDDVHFEPITNLGAALVGPPRVGIYWHVHRQRPGPVEATVGPVVVEQSADSSHTP